MASNMFSPHASVKAMDLLGLPSPPPSASSRASSYSATASSILSSDGFSSSSSAASSLHASDDENDTAIGGDFCLDDSDASDFTTLLEQFRSIIVDDGLSGMSRCVPQRLQHVMRSYISSEIDWARYAYLPTPDGGCRPFEVSDTEEAASASASRRIGPAQKLVCQTGGYSRNLVDSGNGLFNVLILCWPSGSGSKIHDHPGSHCIVKMLSGKLRESRWRIGEEGAALERTSDRTLGRDEVTYMHDKFGLHSMANDGLAPAISLHIYSPPIPLCRVFDPMTGSASMVDCSKVQSVGGIRNE